MRDSERIKIQSVLSKYKDDPIKFCKSILEAHLIYEGQKEILESVKKFPITVCPSGHSTGKSSSAAFITLWWLTTRYKSRVIVTAPTWRQLQTVFYAEVNKWYNKSLIKPFDMFLLKQNIMQFNHEDHKKEWYMLPISPKNPDGLQGQHGDKSQLVEEIMQELGISSIDTDEQISEVIAKLRETDSSGNKKEDNILVIIDEASGVDDKIPEVLEGVDPTRMVVFGNMTRTDGFFYEWAYNMSDESINVITLSSYDSPYMSKAQIESMERRYGKDSDVVRVRLCGLPPTGNENSCIARSLIERNIKIDPLHRFEDFEVMGLDPARFGGDYTVGYSSTGSDFKLEFYFNKESTMQCIGEVARWCRRTPNKKHYLFMDATGLGGPIADRINEIIDEDYYGKDNPNYTPKMPNLEVIEVHFGGSPRNKEEYANAITEMFFVCKDKLEKGNIVIPDDKELVQDLSGRLYNFDSYGRIIVEKKEKFKERLKRSPGKGDAFLLCVYGVNYEAADIIGGFEVIDI